MKMLDRFGRATMGFFEYAGGLATLGGESFGFAVRLRIRYGETVSQCYLLGVQSTIIVLLTGGTKKRQQRDIDAAHTYWQDFKLGKRARS